MAKDDRARAAEVGRAPAGEGRGALVCAVVLCAAGALAYSNSLDGPFVFDDRMHIVDGAAVRRMFDFEDAGLWAFRPLTMVTLAANYAAEGLRTRGYHVVNVAIHLLAGLVLFGLFRRALRLPGLREGLGGAATGPAFAIALLWLLHPIQTGAVTYTIQRMESLMGLLYLTTLYCVVRGLGGEGAGEEGAGRLRSRLWLGAAVAACAGAMAAKEVAVSLPVMALLCDWLLVTRSLKETLRWRWGFYALLGATWLPLLPTLRASLFSPEGTAGFGVAIGPMRYLATQCGVGLHYLGLCFRPWPLCLDYGWPAATRAGEVVPGAVVLGLLLAATLYGLARGGRWALLGAGFFLVLAPTSSVMPIADVAFEHRMYLPLAAVIAGVVLGLWALWARFAPWWRGAAWVAGVALLVAAALLGGLTWRRNMEYQSETGLWSGCIARRPENARAWLNRGAAYARQGRHGEALADLDEAVRRAPGNAAAYKDRGTVFVNLGRYDDAIRDYNEALRLRPAYAAALAERGLAWIRGGDVLRGIEDCTAALAINPGLAQAWSYRGIALAHAGRLLPAEVDCSEAVRLRPDYAEAYANRGMVRDQLGALPGALGDFNRAVELGAGDGDLFLNRGSTLGKMGRLVEAVEDFNRALALRPGDARVFFNRALARQGLGQMEGALADYEEVIALSRDYPSAYINRAFLYLSLGQPEKAREEVARLHAIGLWPPESLLKAIKASQSRRE
jgi:tetratricopeptide (TPR) repeat protein